jgi:hypothetical protein
MSEQDVWADSLLGYVEVCPRCVSMTYLTCLIPRYFHEITVNIHDSVPLLYTAKKHHNKRVQGIKLHICQGSTMHKLQPSSYPTYAEGKTKSYLDTLVVMYCRAIIWVVTHYTVPTDV